MTFLPAILSTSSSRWPGLVCMLPPMLNTPETGLTYVWMTNIIANRYIPYSYDFPTKWDSQPPNHRTAPRTTYIYIYIYIFFIHTTYFGLQRANRGGVAMWALGITGDELLPSLY